ncbi:MAG TPA: hypothetical protein VFR18_03515 [Terriglobia bacterium]|nr:hypothetical protein [Terriglobia bacterium]
MSVDVSLTTPFEVGSSRFLFKSPGSLAMPGGVGILFWDVTPDGERFLFAVPVGQSAAAPYTVVQSWQTLLKR